MSVLDFIKKTTVSLAAVTMATTGCSGGPSISVLPSTDSFTQEGNEITAKMDILWVIDNSGSMIEEQKKLQENFNSFITSFVGKGYDFRIAVITTDAWQTNVYSDTPTGILNRQPVSYTVLDDYTVNSPVSGECDGFVGQTGTPDPTEYVSSSILFTSQFLDGNLNYGEVIDGSTVQGSNSGYRIISSVDNAGQIDFTLTSPAEGDTDSSDDVETIFGKNILQGVCGDGAESGIRSVLTALDNPANGVFPRPDAHLAVIAVTDEEDNIESFNIDNAPEFSIDNVDAAIKAKLQGSSTYSFHTIGILAGDTQCLADSSDVYPANYATKYVALSEKSGGKKISLCSDFSVGLEDIAQSIIETTVEFPLTDVPNSTDGAGFVVSVKNPGDADFMTIPKDPANGWTYNAERNSIIFHGTGIPSQNAEINIFYDPDGL